MLQSQALNQELLQYVSEYNRKTADVVKSVISKLKVGDKGSSLYLLRNSVRTHTYEASGTIYGEIYFKTYGRYRDMGTGSGGRSARKAAKFYSRPWYGRHEYLQGVVQSKIIETGARILHQNLDNI
jgi:hypothetical protein